MRLLVCLALIFGTYEVYAYTQSDLLNAQTNFQAAKDNQDTSKSKYTRAQADTIKAESDVQTAKKNLADAEKYLKSKQESESIAKKKVDTANATYNQSATVVDNMWTQVNGKPIQGKPPAPAPAPAQ